ncbi:MAG: MBL fold metallo-hydrolase [Planctomycetes bacterium]|nr:MBL fold metallo-hydrolase [Planctomycetota bacterium]
MLVKVWGTRGSIPAPSVKARNFITAKYGGNTTALGVRLESGAIISIDAGTGAIALGDALLAEHGFGKNPIELIWLMTHTHWDHVQGFPFFGPAYMPTTKLEFIGSMREGKSTMESSLAVIFDVQQNNINFPVQRNMMPSLMSFKEVRGGIDSIVITGDRKTEIVEHGSIELDKLPKDATVVSTVNLHHPAGCVGFRFQELSTGADFAFVTDNEPDPETDERVRKWLAGTKVCVMDGQYTEDEYSGIKPPSRKGWGHSTPERCVDLCASAGVPHIYITHHEPKHDDDFLDQLLEHTRRHAKEKHGNSIRVDFAFDCIEILVPGV